jgi:hypothetical protein
MHLQTHLFWYAVATNALRGEGPCNPLSSSRSDHCPLWMSRTLTAPCSLLVGPSPPKRYKLFPMMHAAWLPRVVGTSPPHDNIDQVFRAGSKTRTASGTSGLFLFSFAWPPTSRIRPRYGRATAAAVAGKRGGTDPTSDSASVQLLVTSFHTKVSKLSCHTSDRYRPPAACNK